jgi:hypothetical protein
MSNTNDNPNLSPVPDEPKDTVVKENLAKRGWNFVVAHKKAAFAVAGLGALVAVSAMLGREDSSTPVPDDSIEIRETENGFEVIDTTVAN